MLLVQKVDKIHSLPDAQDVTTTYDTLTADLSEGRTISVLLAWHPRLAYASADERSKWRLIGGGEGIHWDDLDEDISVEGLLAGWISAESQSSLKQWLQERESQTA